jgi:hypothetical protein
MSVIVRHEPQIITTKRLDHYRPGTWFIDHYGQIFLLALDDRSDEVRLICAGDFCTPFIANVGVHEVDINRILLPGTTLQITTSENSKGGR